MQIEKRFNPNEILFCPEESSAGINNNNAVIRFLNDKINTKRNIEMSKSTCSAYKKGITNKSCHNCVGKCSEYFYIKEINDRILRN